MQRELPYDINAETGIICTLIHNPEFIVYSDALLPSYFYKSENGAIYWAIQQLYQKGITKIDKFNLETQINSDSRYKKIIESYDKNFINELVENSEFVARSTKEEYIEIVNRVITLSFKRDLYKKLKQFEHQCLDDKINLNQLNLNMINDIDSLASEYVTQDRIPMYNKNIYNIWKKIISKRNEDGTFGIPSKHKILEKYFTYQDGELVLVAARRKHGKSIFGMNELAHMLKQGVSCVYLDTEMSDELFTTRLLSHLTGIEEYRVKAGGYSASEEIMIQEALEWIHKQNFTHIYDPQWTMDKVYTTAKILKNKINFDFLIYDYIKITDNTTTSSSEQYNELGNWCNHLKNNIAGALDIPVLTFAQLNRKYEIADSDKIERYASVGIRWIKKTAEEIAKDGVECGNYKLNIAFNRIGEEMDDDDYIDFVFDRKSLSINVCKKQHEKDIPDFMEEE
mgnify:CR=1 FL=1